MRSQQLPARAQALLPETARSDGALYMPRVSESAIKLLEQAGLVEIRYTLMKGIRGMEYRFTGKAMEFLFDFSRR